MKLRPSRRTTASLVCIVLLMLLTVFYDYGFTGFTITRAGEQAQPAELPLWERSKKPDGIYTLSGAIELSSLSPDRYQIIPDDKLLALTINDEPVDLSNVAESQLADWQYGFNIDLGEYLKTGENSIEFVFKDYSGLYGIRMLSDFGEAKLLPLRLLWAACLGLLIWNVLVSVGLRRDLAALVLAGIGCRILYTIGTDFNVRGHDTDEHLDYIWYFVNNWRLPSVDAANGGAYFHPPLYYMIAAAFYRISELFHPHQPRYAYGVLQYLSVAFSAGFLVYSALLVDKIFQVFRDFKSAPASPVVASHRHYQRIGAAALALIAFWPSAIMHGARIGNDPLLYFSFIAGLYYIYCFFVQPSARLFLLGASFTAVAVATKANGAILVAVGGIALLTVWRVQKPAVNLALIRKGLVPCMIIIAALALAFYPGIALKIKGDRTHLYVDNIDNVSSALRVGNRAGNYLWMDLKTFISKPYTSPYDDEFGRQYFANYLSKTGLVGEWSFSGTLAENTAVVLSAAYILMLLLLVIGFYHFRKGDFLNSSPVLWGYLLLLASVYYMRMTFPVNIDFRYVLPVLVPFAIFYNLGMIRLYESGKRRIATTGYTVEGIFVVASLLFLLHFFLRP